MKAVRQLPNLARVSTMGKRRAAVLIGVHVAIALHIWHWKATGRTITPVEPSEAMQTLELGAVNAGFLFFLVAILSTLVFGRWFCGWGCHVVALQDLCGWMLKKVGIRPKPIRSRLLVWIPVFAAFYMFVYPQIARLWAGRPAPAWSMHLTTERFWATFPNLPIALFTLGVCGFLVVYLLGNKGFCTYGCPYGGIFYHADRLAAGKIRVTSDCNQCGHCTSVCSSNVRVSEEVLSHGMVVDPGCMKCMDCVSVCPNDALYYGFGRPAAGAKPLALPVVQTARAAAPKAIPYDFTWGEEVALAVMFLGSFYAFRGLYEAIPFLLALGLAAISAFSILHGARLLYRQNVRFQRWQLRTKGRFSAAGIGYGIAAAGLAAFLVHSGVVQFHIHEANRHLALAQALQIDPGKQMQADEEARAARTHLLAGREIGWYPVAEWEYKLGSLAQFLGDEAQAMRQFEAALELDPNRPNTRIQLAELYIRQSEFARAVEEFRKAADSGGTLGAAWSRYAEALIASGSQEGLEQALQNAIAHDPHQGANHANLGMLYAAQGQLDKAEQNLATATGLDGSNAGHWMNLGLVRASRSEWPEARTALEKALDLKPDLAGARASLARVLLELGERAQAMQAARQALDEAPLEPAVVSDYLAVVRTSRQERAEIARLAVSAAKTPPLHYGLSGLYRSVGEIAAAESSLAEARKIRPNLPAL